jgi:hypothetical protein
MENFLLTIYIACNGIKQVFSPRTVFIKNNQIRAQIWHYKKTTIIFI